MFGMAPDGPDAEPEVVASLVSYLCKPEAHFITGAYELVYAVADTLV